MTLSLATERALDACYGALTEPSRWEDALSLLAHSMGASACQILPPDYSGRPFDIARSSGMWHWDEHWQRNADWVTDIHAAWGMPRARNGQRTMLQRDLFSDEELYDPDFHQLIARPAGCCHWATSSFIVEDRVWCLPFFRNIEPFTETDRQQLAEIATHMARIVSLAEKFARNCAEHEVLALERIGHAAMLLDRSGCVTGLNHLAETLICRDFCVRLGRIRTTDTASDARIRRFISDLAQDERGALPPPAPIVVSRAGLPWLLLEAMPVTAAASDVFQKYRAIIVLNDLGNNCVTDTARLCLVFGLTSSEARLVGLLLNGHNLNGAALELGVSRETVRSQIKSAFAKTDTHCQSQLVARVARMSGTAQH